MNDFTKDELQDIFRCVTAFNLASKRGGSIYYDSLNNKIQSMIDNFCEHESDEELRRKGGCIPGHLKCKKCGEFYK